MNRKWIRRISVLMTAIMVMGSTLNVFAAAEGDLAGASATAEGEAQGAPDTDGGAAQPSDTDVPTAAGGDSTQNDGSEPTDSNLPNDIPTTLPSDTTTGADTQPDTPQSDAGTDAAAPQPDADEAPQPDTEDSTGGDDDISGTVTTDDKDISGTITVEEDKNDDKVEIKKNDRPYLALGADLSAEQRATVLAIMGIDASKLGDYDVVNINNSEEHQYLGSYIESGKIGTKSLSSVVIVERKDGNGINISTNNITYCTVGMYKNALATAGIQNADIIVAAPFPMSGTAALVGVFKAYKEMTGDEVDEENIDAALHELVVTGALEEKTGADSDEIEGMIAYVKQAVLERDLSNADDIRSAITEGCEKFNITLTDEEMGEVVSLMQKIGELDLDLDGLMNAAQSIYDKISHADGGFWAKIRELLQTLVAKVKELFS